MSICYRALSWLCQDIPTLSELNLCTGQFIDHLNRKPTVLKDSFSVRKFGVSALNTVSFDNEEEVCTGVVSTGEWNLDNG